MAEPLTRDVGPRLTTRLHPRALLLAAGAAALAACGGSRLAPSPDAPPPPAPDLTGAVVMLLPTQESVYTRRPADGGGSSGEMLDAELAFWLQDHAPHVRWVTPGRLREHLARSPGLGIDIAHLDVAVFRHAQVKRIGDPLFGDLVRLGSLAGAQFALIPTFAAYAPGANGGPGRLELAATLIDCSDGRVHWFGVVAGEPGAPGERATAASAAQALARALFR
ncbi:MAG TPA: hypothetical protein VF192_02105 [Longimicrobiales bacterium]